MMDTLKTINLGLKFQVSTFAFYAINLGLKFSYHPSPNILRIFAVMDLDDGQVVNYRAFLDPTRVGLTSVDAFLIVGNFFAKILFPQKSNLGLEKSRHFI